MRSIKHFIPVVAATVLVACSSLPERTVNITEMQMQQKLEAHLKTEEPLTVMKLFKVKFSNPLIKLDSSTERLRASFDAQVTSVLGVKPMNGTATISGKLRFDAASNSVLLTESKIEALNIEGLERTSEVINMLAKKIDNELLDGLPIYTFKSNELSMIGISFVPKNMKVTAEGLQIVIAPKK